MCLLPQPEDTNETKPVGIRPLQENYKIWNSPLFRQIGNAHQKEAPPATCAHNNEKQLTYAATGIYRMFVVLGPLSLVFCAGMALGTATVMIPQIKSNNSSMQLTKEMESWLYSMHGFAATPAVLIVPYLSQVKGYKFAFTVICIPVIISWFLQYFATNSTHLLIAVIGQGLTMGGNVTLGIIIVSEFAAPKYRGPFLIFKSATYFWGTWTSNAIGTFFSWRIIPLVGISPAVFALVSSFLWPESPYWLASKNRMEECKKAFRWVRGQDHDAERELIHLTSRKPSEQKSKYTFVFFKTTMLCRQFYMPLFLNIAMFFLFQSCGKFVFQTYILVIIKDITKDNATAYTGMLIIDGVTVFGMYLGSYVAAKVNRRTLLLSTTASTIFFLFIFSAYLYLIKFNVITQNNTASLSLLILYTFSVSWGPMVLCAAIYSEITPMRFKAFLTSVTVGFNFVIQTGFLKVAPYIFKGFGVNGSFALYGTLTIFPFLFLYKYLPETRNKTFDEIESCFMKKSYHNDNLNGEGQEMLNCTENKNI